MFAKDCYKGSFFKKGDFIKFEKLAITLETIASSGGDGEFYSGSLSDRIINDMRYKGKCTCKGIYTGSVKRTPAP